MLFNGRIPIKSRNPSWTLAKQSSELKQTSSSIFYISLLSKQSRAKKSTLLLEHVRLWAELTVFLPQKCTFTLSDVDQSSFFFRSLRVGVMSSRLDTKYSNCKQLSLNQFQGAKRHGKIVSLFHRKWKFSVVFLCSKMELGTHFGTLRAKRNETFFYSNLFTP